MADPQDRTGHTQQLLDRLAKGDDKAIEALIEHSLDRLRRLARMMLRQDPRVRRWEETDDVTQNVAQRLVRALRDVRPTDTKAYFGLAATQIRRELIDLARHHFGPEGAAAHHITDQKPASDGKAPAGLEGKTDSKAKDALEQIMLHEQVQALPEEDREVFELIHYLGMEQAEAAKSLGISVPTVKRRWRAARLRLRELLQS